MIEAGYPMEPSRHAIFGHSTRMRAILAFEPILGLRGKHKFQEYDLVGLGLQALLFVLENMLMAYTDCSPAKVARHIGDVMRRGYGQEIDPEKVSEISDFLLAELRNNGAPFKIPYYDIEKLAWDTHDMRLLVYDEYNIVGNSAKLKLTPEGLDLLFRTREFLAEIKISITQLFLRQQIQKGIFNEALRTVQELSVQVHDIAQSIKAAESRIRSDPHKAAKDGDYKRLSDRINFQLEREREAFKGLTDLIDQKIELERMQRGEQEVEKVIMTILRIKKDLQEVVVAHEKILGEKINLGNLQLEALHQSLTFSFKTPFNLAREVIWPSMRGLSDPKIFSFVLGNILPPWIERKFSIDKITQKQQLNRPGARERDAEMDAGPDTLDLIIAAQEEQRKKHEEEEDMAGLLSLLVSPLKSISSYQLSTLDSLLNLPGHRAERLSNLLIRIHQTGDIKFEHSELPTGEDSFWIAVDRIKEELLEVDSIKGFRIAVLESNKDVFLAKNVLIQDVNVSRLEAKIEPL